MINSYKTVGPNGKSNGTNFFSLCSMQLGKDYKTWSKHPAFNKTLEKAHEVLRFEGTISALGLRTEFLSRNHLQTTETKLKRQCYNDVLFDALGADIIDIETVKKLLV